MAAKTQELALLDQRLIAALSHPTRAHALNVCTQRAASPKEIAAELGEDVSGVAYHFDKLLKLGCVEEVKTKKRRAATEHWYRATVKHFFDADTWQRVPEKDRLKITLDLISLMSGDLGQAVQAGTLDGDDNHISRTVLKLDQTGWAEIVARLAETLEDVLAIKERAATRLATSDEKPVHARVSIIHFESPPPPS